MVLKYADISYNLKQATRETMQGTTTKWKTYRTPTVKWKRIQTNQIKAIIFSHFYLKTKQTHANYAVRAAKRTGNALRQLYEAIIPTWWEHLTYQNKPKNPKPSSIQQQPTATKIQKKNGTAKITNTRSRKENGKLTSQRLESAQQSARKIPECSTGNADSKHDRPAAGHGTAGQSTSEPQL